jgi:AcrR family transcriptional regulator
MSVAARKTRTRRPKKPQRSRRHSPEEAGRVIKDSAVRLLWKRPFRDLTVPDVMAGTPLSRPAFYQYFANLHELVESLLRDFESTVQETTNPWISGEGEPIAALRKSLGGLIQVCVEQGPILRAVTEAAPFDKRLERDWAAYHRRQDEAVEARIKAQQREGLIPRLDALRVAHALNALNAALLSREFGALPQADPRAVLNTLHRIWVGTLYAQPPGKLALERSGRKSRS